LRRLRSVTHQVENGLDVLMLSQHRARLAEQPRRTVAFDRDDHDNIRMRIIEPCGSIVAAD